MATPTYFSAINIFLGVVHTKTKFTQKESEIVVMEWLRHAKQRRLREKKNYF